jgi:hypothetical protein
MARRGLPKPKPPEVVAWKEAVERDGDAPAPEGYICQLGRSGSRISRQLKRILPDSKIRPIVAAVLVPEPEEDTALAKAAKEKRPLRNGTTGEFVKGHNGVGTTREAAQCRSAWEKVFRERLTPQKMAEMVDTAYGIAVNPDHPQCAFVFKYLADRMLGKVAQTIDVNQTNHLTIEERRTRVLSLLGVHQDDAALRFRDGTPAFIDQPGDREPGAASLSGPIPDGPLALPDLGEVPPRGGDVGVGAEVRVEARHAEQEDGPPVQQ